MKNYELKQFTPKTLASTRRDWEHVAGKDAFATEYGLVFEWTEKHIDYANGHNDSLAYGMFAPRAQKAVAIVEVIQRKVARKGLTKMLKLWITPEYWDAAASRKEIAHVMLSAMQGTLLLSKNNQSKTVKIYGRNEQMLSVLHTVHIMLSELIEKEDLKGIAVNIVDRWLEIKVDDQERKK